MNVTNRQRGRHADRPRYSVGSNSPRLVQLMRVVQPNNSNNEVVRAESTNTFKSRLDKFWSNQEIIYDYRAEIQGTGSRSVNY